MTSSLMKTAHLTELVMPIWIYTSPAVLQFLKCLLQIRLGLPGWKSRFYREYFGLETSSEIGNLQNDMVIFSLVHSFIMMDPFPLRRGNMAFCIVVIFPPFLFLSSLSFPFRLRSIQKDFAGCFSAILRMYHHGAGKKNMFTYIKS